MAQNDSSGELVSVEEAFWNLFLTSSTLSTFFVGEAIAFCLEDEKHATRVVYVHSLRGAFSQPETSEIVTSCTESQPTGPFSGPGELPVHLRDLQANGLMHMVEQQHDGVRFVILRPAKEGNESVDIRRLLFVRVRGSQRGQRRQLLNLFPDEQRIHAEFDQRASYFHLLVLLRKSDRISVKGTSFGISTAIGSRVFRLQPAKVETA